MLLLWFCRTVFFCYFEYLLFLKYVDVILVIFDLLYIYVWGIIALCTVHLAMRGVNLVYWIVNEYCFERGVILYFWSVRVCHKNASLYIHCYFCSSKLHYVWFSSLRMLYCLIELWLNVSFLESFSITHFVTCIIFLLKDGSYMIEEKSMKCIVWFIERIWGITNTQNYKKTPSYKITIITC
jgi:hypothetical protein